MEKILDRASGSKGTFLLFFFFETISAPVETSTTRAAKLVRRRSNRRVEKTIVALAYAVSSPRCLCTNCHAGETDPPEISPASVSQWSRLIADIFFN